MEQTEAKESPRPPTGPESGISKSKKLPFEMNKPLFFKPSHYPSSHQKRVLHI